MFFPCITTLLYFTSFLSKKSAVDLTTTNFVMISIELSFGHFLSLFYDFYSPLDTHLDHLTSIFIATFFIFTDKMIPKVLL